MHHSGEGRAISQKGKANMLEIQRRYLTQEYFDLLDFLLNEGSNV
jgi:hypothetical protein